MSFHLKFTSQAFDKLDAGCAVVTTFADERPLRGNAALVDWRMNGRLSKVLMASRFMGDFKEMLLMPSEGRLKSNTVLVCGLGASRTFGENNIGSLFQVVLDKVSKKGDKAMMFSLSHLIPDRFEWRNAVRLFVSILRDYPSIETVYMCEEDELVRDAKKRHMDFGMNVDVSFESFSFQK